MVCTPPESRYAGGAASDRAATAGRGTNGRWLVCWGQGPCRAPSVVDRYGNPPQGGMRAPPAPQLCCPWVPGRRRPLASDAPGRVAWQPKYAEARGQCCARSGCGSPPRRALRPLKTCRSTREQEQAAQLRQRHPGGPLSYQQENPSDSTLPRISATRRRGPGMRVWCPAKGGHQARQRTKKMRCRSAIYVRQEKNVSTSVRRREESPRNHPDQWATIQSSMVGPPAL